MLLRHAHLLETRPVHGEATGLHDAWQYHSQAALKTSNTRNNALHKTTVFLQMDCHLSRDFFAEILYNIDLPSRNICIKYSLIHPPAFRSTRKEFLRVHISRYLNLKQLSLFFQGTLHLEEQSVDQGWSSFFGDTVSWKYPMYRRAASVLR